MARYRFLDHTADLMIEVEADDLVGLFREAAESLFDVIVGIGSIHVREFVEVSASGEGTEELLVDWLRELLYRFSGEGMVLAQFEVIEFSETSIRARCGGERFSPDAHEVRFDIKAVTYHRLSIRRENGIVRASLVFDV
jgi:SHS2 domain-containing protein